MEIRPARVEDLGSLIEIDGTIESSYYLHVDRSGEGLAAQWRLEERPFRQKLIDRNRLTDEQHFLLKQIVTGVEEGIALLAEHDEAKVALLVGHYHLQWGTMNLVDLRVDSDYRRQGLATAMIFQTVTDARARNLRAVAAECQTGNAPMNHLLVRTGFELAGLDTQRRTNHDLVKEAVTLFWYAALD